MSRIPRFLYTLAVFLLPPGPGFAQDHIVSAEDVRSHLARATADRVHDLRTVDAFLSTPAAIDAAALLGTDLRQARATAATLSNHELRDIAARAESLTTDPTAGASTPLIVLAVLGGVLILLVILYALECSGDAWC